MPTVLFLGDSIGARPNGYVDQVSAQLRARPESRPDLQIVNSSVDSSNVLDLLDRAQETLPSNPVDVAVVFVGINDSKILTHIGKELVPLVLFAERLEDLAHRLEVGGSRVILCGLPLLRFRHIKATGVLDQYWHWDPDRYGEYGSAIRSTAASRPGKRFFVDLESAFAAHNDRAPLFEADGVHPTDLGHETIAGAILEVLVPLASSDGVLYRSGQ